MQYQNVTLHNVAEVQPVAGGVRLQRVPEAVRQQLNPKAQERALFPANCEIRFITDADVTQITLSCEYPTPIRVFHGLFDGRVQEVIGPEPTTITLARPALLSQLERDWWRDHPFDPAVYRLVFSAMARAPVCLHAINGKGHQPPRPEQLPKRTYLAYGTSITQGAKSEAPHLSYAAQTAWRLGADLVNLGFGSSAHCEPALADYIASRADWDLATFEVSVNMLGFPLDEFRRRVEYLIHTVGSARPARPIAGITLLPFHRDCIVDAPASPSRVPAEAFRQCLREAVTRCGLPNVHLIEGPELLRNLGGLTMDLIHPSDHGMIEIAQNLALRLQPLLP